MRFLRSHHITKLIQVIDAISPRALPNPQGGRPVILHQNETIALLLFSSFVAPQRTLKGIYIWAQTFFYRKFNLPSYKSWIRKCHQALPAMLLLLDLTLDKQAPLRLMDSTMLHVCKLIRSDRHKVAKGIANYGANWQGWHYGFKLHVSIAPTGRFSALRFTAANAHDAQQIPYLVNEFTLFAVGDGTYNARVMRERIWREYRCLVVAPPHPKQSKKLLAEWQKQLLGKRVKIECTFDYLKEHLFLESSFPRSITGYFVHYVRVLLGYQMGRGF